MTTGESSTGRLTTEVNWILDSQRHIARRAREDERAGQRPRLRTHIHTGLGVHPRDWQERGSEDFIYCQGQVIVDDADVPRVQQALAEDGIESEIADSLFNGVSLLAVSADSVDVVERLDARFGVGIATPNHVLSISPSHSRCPATEPDEPGSTDPWPGLGDRDDGRGVRVAVVDTGFLQGWESRAPWLAGISQYDVDSPDVLEPKGFIDPYAGHGTFVAGVVRCLAPASDVTVDGIVEVAGVADEVSIVKQVSEALDRSPDLLNLSAGCYTRRNLPPKAFVALWERRLRHHKGVVVVAAAGNEGGREPFWPAAFPWAVSVGALTADGRQRADFSNFGGWVDVYAPGVDIVNAYCEGEYRYLLEPEVTRKFYGMCKWSGTSFSTPIVAGMIAARMSRTGENALQAADTLLEAARGQFLPGVGPRLLP